MAGPNQGEVYDGYRYMGGDPKSQSSWEQAGPIDVSSEWGSGARQLPNGTIERVGPRGGVTQIGTAEGSRGASDDVGKLTEAQGKAVLYGSMMAGGERDYQDARRRGYNPGSFRNQVADFADLIPFDGGAIPRLIRDDVSDSGVQAERRFTEANLRQLSGAAVTPSEVTRTVAINFDRGNDALTDQRQRTRAETYRGTRATAGSGAGAIPDFPSAYGSAGNIGENGLPTYPGLTAAVSAAGIKDNPTIDGPQPGDVVTTSQPLAPEDTPASLSAQGYTYDPGSDTWKRTRTAEARGWTPESAVAQRDQMNPVLRNIDAFGRGFADIGSLEFADEIAAGADAAFGQGVGKNFGERFRNNVEVQRAIDEDDGRDYGFARNAGEVAGGVAAALVAAPKFVGRSALNIANPLLRGAVNFGRNALGGAAIAGTAAAGNERGDALSRAQAFMKAAPVGAVVGGALPLGLAGAGAADRLVGAPVARSTAALGRYAGRVAGQTGAALGVPGATRLTERNTVDPLQSAIDQFAPRMGRRRIDALEGNIQAQRDLGFNPTLADGLDDAGQGSLRALGSIDTPARPLAVDFGRARRADAQGDVSDLSRRFISNDPRSASRVASDLDEAQSAASGPAYDAARASGPVTITPDVGEALFGGDGPQVLRGAASAYSRSVSPSDRAIALELEQLATRASEGVPAGGIEMSVGAADLISRYLAKAGGTDANLMRINQGLGRAIRRQARDQSPEYEAALSGYAERAALEDAAEFGSKFLGRRGTQDFVNEATAMTAPQREVARVAARDAVEDAGATTGGAASLLDDLSIGRGRGQRTDAFVEDPEGMRAFAEGARNRLNTGRNVDPRAGSNTNLNRGDSDNVGDAVQFLSDGAQIAARPIMGTLTVAARRLQNRGFNKDEAEAIVTAAIDPNRTDDLIRMLQQSGMARKEARSFARSLQYNLSAGTGASSVQ